MLGHIVISVRQGRRQRRAFPLCVLAQKPPLRRGTVSTGGGEHNRQEAFREIEWGDEHTSGN